MILMISGRVNRMSVLVVCGVMIGYICSAITDFMVTFAEDSNIVNLHNWSLGQLFRHRLGECQDHGAGGIGGHTSELPAVQAHGGLPAGGEICGKPWGQSPTASAGR